MLIIIFAIILFRFKCQITRKSKYLSPWLYEIPTSTFNLADAFYVQINHGNQCYLSARQVVCMHGVISMVSIQEILSERRNQSHPWFQYRKPSLQEEESESSMVSIQETLSSREGIRDINGFNTGNPLPREGIRVNTGYPFFKRRNLNH